MTKFPSPVPIPGGDQTTPDISREIYGMPAFATLLSSDVSALVDWYTTGLGFIELFAIPGPSGAPLLVHLRRWQFQDLLVRPAPGPVVPGSTITLSFAAVIGELDQLVARARTHGGGGIGSPFDTRWNTRDVITTDPDGNTVIFTAGRPPEATNRDFSAQMAEWNEEQGLSS